MNNENVEELGGNSSGSDSDAINPEGSSSDSENSNQEDVAEGNHSDSIIDNASRSSDSSDDLPPPIRREEELVEMSDSDDPDLDVGEPLYWSDDDGPFLEEDVAVVPRLHEFETPSRKISTYDDMQPFHQWEAMQNFFGFIVALTRSVQGMELQSVGYVSSNIKKILRVLNEISSWIDEEMPEGPNQSKDTYLSWQLRLFNGEGLMKHVVSDHRRGAANEIFFYFMRAFGSLDDVFSYGLHHELQFIAWLYCLARLGTITSADFPAIVAKAVLRYREIIKKMKETFKVIEGVKAIGNSPSNDEFVSYIFGASELIGKEIRFPLTWLRNYMSTHLVTQSLFYRLVWEKTDGGGQRTPMNIRKLGDEIGWNQVTTELLGQYKAMLGERRILGKLRSGSLIQLI